MSSWVLLAFLGLGSFSGLYVVAVGGDYIHARLFLPAYFALCAPVAVVALAKRYAIAFAVLPWALAAGLALRPPAGARPGRGRLPVRPAATTARSRDPRGLRLGRGR